MTEQSFWNEMERRVAKYDLLCHPFYKAWSEGKLTRDDLREYAADYFHHVAAFPRYLDQLQARLPESALRDAIVGNWEEETGVSADEVDAKQGRAHDELWLQFAEGMGGDAQEIRAGRPIAEIQNLIDTFSRTARERSAAEALAAFYAYESQVPRIAADERARFARVVRRERRSVRVLHAARDRGRAAQQSLAQSARPVAGGRPGAG